MVAQPKWRLGQIGEFGAFKHSCYSLLPNTTGVRHVGGA